MFEKVLYIYMDIMKCMHGQLIPENLHNVEIFDFTSSAMFIVYSATSGRNGRFWTSIPH